MTPAMIIVGTRPEAIKLAPVILALRQKSSRLKPIVCLTGQHPEIAQQAFDVFDIRAEINMNCVPPGGDLCKTAASVIEATGHWIDKLGPAAVIVQGDTLSAFAGGFATVLRRIPMAHVEAGLRSGNLADPFPEELSRRQLTQIATWNFAPTVAAIDNLLRENVAQATIHLVGNTVVDALRIARTRIAAPHDDTGRLVLVSAHRRENWGMPMASICTAVRTLASRHDDWRFVFGLHPNPQLQSVIRRALADLPNVQLVSAPPYDEWLQYLFSSELIMTDSGGMQEEGCAIGRPVLVLRDTTERPEAIDAGAALLVGRSTDAIVRQAERVMGDPAIYAEMARPRDVFGNGHAADRISEILHGDLQLDAELNATTTANVN